MKYYEASQAFKIHVNCTQVLILSLYFESFVFCSASVLLLDWLDFFFLFIYYYSCLLHYNFRFSVVINTTICWFLHVFPIFNVKTYKHTIYKSTLLKFVDCLTFTLKFATLFWFILHMCLSASMFFFNIFPYFSSSSPSNTQSHKQ